MRITLHRHRHYDCHNKTNHRNEKKGLKIMKKMVILEKKLKKYNFNNGSSENDSPISSCSNSRSQSPSRLRNKCKSYRRNKQKKGYGFYHENISSDSDSNLSNSESSRSISAYDSHQHRASSNLPRSRSFSGSSNYFLTPLSRRHYRHYHSYFLHHGDQLPHHNQNEILGLLFKILAQSEPDLKTATTETRNENVYPESGFLQKSSGFATHESSISDTIFVNANENTQKIKNDTESHNGDSVQETEINKILSDDSLKIIQNGLPLDMKKYLLKKYRINENCVLLKGPEINKEILSAIRKTVIKKDTIQMYEQNQIGAGLVALGQAIFDLNNKSELKKDKDVINILETLNEAAAIILDTHHNMTIKRQLLMLPELNKKFKSIIKDCRADKYLYGMNFGEKIKNFKIFIKRRKIWKNRILENQCDNKEIHEYNDNDDEKLKKRSYSSKKSI